MLSRHTTLHIFSVGTVNVQPYENEILEAYVMLFQAAVGPDIMDANVKTSKTHFADDFLGEENILCMNWLLRYPDLNLIAYVWSDLERAIAQCNPTPRTRQELKTMLWKNELCS